MPAIGVYSTTACWGSWGGRIRYRTGVRFVHASDPAFSRPTCDLLHAAGAPGMNCIAEVQDREWLGGVDVEEDCGGGAGSNMHPVRPHAV